MSSPDKYSVEYWNFYQAQLHTDEWQSRRREILRRDNYTCQECGAKGCDNTLHVHHKGYVSSLLPWEYPDDALITLCESCHQEVHKKQVRPFVSTVALVNYIHSFDDKFNFDTEKMRVKWEEYKSQWCEFIWSYHPPMVMHHPFQCGTCLPAEEYAFYKKNKYNIEEIKAYSWSGKVAYEVMLDWRLKANCNYNLEDDNSWGRRPILQGYKYNYYAPGYYKIIYLYEDTIGAFYSAKETDDFVAEEIILPRHSLDNSQPYDILLGDIILIKRCELKDNRYEIDWLNWSREKEIEDLQAELSRCHIRYNIAMDSNSQWSVEFHSGADCSSSEPPYPDEAIDWLVSEINRIEREIKIKTQELIRRP